MREALTGGFEMYYHKKSTTTMEISRLAQIPKIGVQLPRRTVAPAASTNGKPQLPPLLHQLVEATTKVRRARSRLANLADPENPSILKAHLKGVISPDDVKQIKVDEAAALSQVTACTQTIVQIKGKLGADKG